MRAAVNRVKREHHRRAPHDQAQDFIRAGTLPGNMRAPKAKEPDMTDTQPEPSKSRGDPRASMNGPAQRSGIQVRERNGIWEVRVDGKFRGDYHQQEHALAAAALHKVAPR